MWNLQYLTTVRIVKKVTPLANDRQNAVVQNEQAILQPSLSVSLKPIDTGSTPGAVLFVLKNRGPGQQQSWNSEANPAAVEKWRC